MFAKQLDSFGDRLAVVTDRGVHRTYAQLARDADQLAREHLQTRRLVIVETANTLECLAAYLACLRAQCPVILAEPGSTARDERIARTFAVATVFRASNRGKWRFEPLPFSDAGALHSDLCVLLSTSGTTGSPKLVRLSCDNIESNAASIARYLDIAPADRAITSLPAFYSFGMSVINSHLFAGATLLLTDESVASNEFWQFFERERASTFSAVPFTFDVLERRRFRESKHPSLRYVAQAGGRLPKERVIEYGEWARASGVRFFVMYGQTEAAPRMSYVPPEQLLENPESIGVPIPGGSFDILDDQDHPIADVDVPGELLYRGPNVMMGYAESRPDLALGAGPPELRTGDIACRKANGLYRIVGRKSRFSKIVGLRVSLDEIERWVHEQGWSGIVNGDDRLIAVATSRPGTAEAINASVLGRFGLPASALRVLHLDPLPTLPSGKFDYRAVLSAAHDAAGQARARDRDRPLVESFREVLGIEDVRPSDCFLDLDGDSVGLVEMSLVLEDQLGWVPENWEAMPIEALEALKESAVPGRDSGVVSGAPGPDTGRRRFFAAAAMGAGLLASGEIALQIRSYIRTGRSAAALITGESSVVINPAFGLRTYRPNLVIEGYQGSGGRFTTNSMGLRSREITVAPAPGELRLIVTGASTTAGAYAKTNDQTFSGILEHRFRQRLPDRVVNVVNAGIEGYTVSEIELLIDRALIGLRPGAILLYAGSNDMGDICHQQRRNAPRLAGLPTIDVPGWALTRELISKNTALFREARIRPNAVDPDTYTPTSYRETIERIVQKVSNAGIVPVLVTVARTFNGLPIEQQLDLAQSALFFNPCLDTAGVIKAGDKLNNVMREIAASRKIPLIDLARDMPGGTAYFVDTGHFTLKGESFAADYLYENIRQDPLLIQRLGLAPPGGQRPA